MSTEPVGSLSEEAAKLLALLQDWASPPGHDVDGADPTQGGSTAGGPSSSDEEPPPGPSAAHAAHAAHVFDGSECQWCPLCRLARVAKATNPQVREHLTNAAASIALAVQELLAPPSGGDEDGDRDSSIEKIDLAED